jgi:hypothetical protein
MKMQRTLIAAALILTVAGGALLINNQTSPGTYADRMMREFQAGRFAQLHGGLVHQTRGVKDAGSLMTMHAAVLAGVPIEEMERVQHEVWNVPFGLTRFERTSRNTEDVELWHTAHAGAITEDVARQVYGRYSQHRLSEELSRIEYLRPVELHAFVYDADTAFGQATVTLLVYRGLGGWQLAGVRTEPAH